jgi:hypothetical protein
MVNDEHMKNENKEIMRELGLECIGYKQTE